MTRTHVEVHRIFSGHITIDSLRKGTSSNVPHVDEQVPEVILEGSRVLQVEHEDVADDDDRVEEEEGVHADAVPQDRVERAEEGRINGSDDVSEKSKRLHNQIPKHSASHQAGQQVVDKGSIVGVVIVDDDGVDKRGHD